MQRIKQFFCFGVISLIFFLLTPAFTQNTVAITEFLSDSKGSEVTCEWVELYNYGIQAVNLSGWSLVDDDTDIGIIPGGMISPGEYMIIARDKTGFEVDWLAGIPNPSVVQFTGTFALSSTTDELILKNSGGTEVWRIAYMDDDTLGYSTYLTDTTFLRTSWGSKSSPEVNRRGTDIGGGLGYESNDATYDAYQYSGGNLDWGSPLRGHYSTPLPVSEPHIIQADIEGVPFNPGIRGVALSDITLERGSWFHGIPDSLTVSDGGSLRGVAGGLYVKAWKAWGQSP